MTGPLSIAEEFAITVNAKVTLPTRPLLKWKDGEARHYFTHTDIRQRFERLIEVDFNDDEAYRIRRAA